MQKVEDFKLKTFKLFFEGIAFISVVTFDVIPLWLVAVVFIIADYLTKTNALRKQGVILEHNGWKRSIDKSYMFLIGLFSASLLQVMFFPTIEITKYVAAYICIRELESIFKNIGLTEVFYTISDKLGLGNFLKRK